MSAASSRSRRPYRTISEVARSIRRSESDALVILRQLRRAGVAEEFGDGWRLTPRWAAYLRNAFVTLDQEDAAA